MHWKINWHGDLFMNGENLHGKKSHHVILRSPLPRIHYYHKQAVTSKGIPGPYTNLQLNSYLNTQFDLFCSDNLSFLMHSSQYVTNQFNAWIPVRDLLTNLRKILTAKFFSLSTWWKSRNFLVTKPYGIHSSFLNRKIN